MTTPAHRNRFLFEALLTLLVLAFLYWQFSSLRQAGNDNPGGSDTGQVYGDGQRYLRDVWLQAGLLSGEAGSGHLAAFCASHGKTLPSDPAWDLCREAEAEPVDDAGTVTAWPRSLDATHDALQQAIRAGLDEPRSRLATLAKSQAEGILPEAAAREVATLQRRVGEYRSFYDVASGASAATPETSRSLACAWRYLKGRFAVATNEAERRVLIGNASALVDGRAQRLASDAAALLAGEAGWRKAMAPAEVQRCAEAGGPETVLRRGADIAGQVRHGADYAHKAGVMTRLLGHAHWLFTAWALTALALLNLGRRAELSVRFVPLALLVWSLVGWVTGVPAPQYAFPVAAALSFALFLGVTLLRAERWPPFGPVPRQVPTTFMAFPMFVLFVGIGWWIAFDLAANGYLRNRFLAYSQTTYVFTALVAISLLPALRLAIAGVVTRVGALLLLALRAGTTPLERLRPWLLGGLLGGGLLAAAVVLHHWRQFTSELFRVWLLVGVAWLFLARNKLWGNQQLSLGGLAKSLAPLAGLTAVVFLGQLVTDDMGPLLVILYASGVFAGAMAANTLLARGGTRLTAALAGIGCTVLVAALLTGGLFGAARLPVGAAARVAERLESSQQPFAARNDQMAHVHWFRAHTPESGYGLGAVPWCGTLVTTGCHGVPPQTQSDYTPTALHGIYGQTGALLLLALYVAWLAGIAMTHAAWSDGMLDGGNRWRTAEAWTAWLAVAWVTLTVAQVIVTVAGNLGWLPLTGVTLPFVSYGAWSLLVNTVFLGLVISRLETTP